MLSDLAGGRKLNPACWREVCGGVVIRNKRIPATELQRVSETGSNRSISPGKSPESCWKQDWLKDCPGVVAHSGSFLPRTFVPHPEC